MLPIAPIYYCKLQARRKSQGDALAPLLLFAFAWLRVSACALCANLLTKFEFLSKIYVQLRIAAAPRPSINHATISHQQQQQSAQ
jgi:hypothetical protein